MKLKNRIFILGISLLGLTHNATAQTQQCNGKFANLITDYCWSAHFPIRMAGVEVFSMNQEDNNSTSGTDLVCTCGQETGATLDLKVGTTVSFWESSHIVDIARKPFCLVGLGGIDLGDVMDAPASGRSTRGEGGHVNSTNFYHGNLYANPILYFIGVASDNPCLTQTPFDLYYSTSWDPLWNDEETTMMLNPDAYLYANPAAMLAVTADCIATSSGFSSPEIYWSAGCQGGMFPLTGMVSTHTGTARSASLLLQKFLSKGHRELLLWGTSYGGGEAGLCYKYPKYMIDKTDYKYSMLFPTPQTKKGHLCAQPLGRSTQIWAAGTTFPFYGEDVSFQVLRKVDCCMGPSDVDMAN